MTGNCRFLRVKGGICYFADVTADLFVEGDTVELVDALPATPNVGAGEVNRQSADAWVRAALDGIHAAIAKAQQLGLLADGCQVKLVRLLGTDMDTRDDVIQCAAALATWQALDGPKLDPEFEGGQWTVQYPARLEAAVQETNL